MTKLTKGSIPFVYFEGLDQWIKDNQNSMHEIRWAMDKIAMGYAMVALGSAQRDSLGPLDPQQRRGSNAKPSQPLGMIATTRAGGYRTYRANPAAWQIPVRRITGDYYAGWQVKRVSQGHWQLLNESREAYFIELGISPHGGVRIKRPILKRSVMWAIAFARGTRFDERSFVSFLAQHSALGSQSSAASNLLPQSVTASVRGTLQGMTG